MSIEARNEAERALVSFAFTSPTVFARYAASVNPADFADPNLGRLCWVLCKMQSTMDLQDLNAVLLELSRIGELKSFGAAEIAKLATSGYFDYNAEFYAERVRHYGKIDRVRRAATKLLQSCEEDFEDRSDIDQALADFHADTTKVFKPKDESRKLVELGEQLLNRMMKPEENVAPKIITGFDCIDIAAGGMFPGQLVLLSGRSYRGKTMLAGNIANKMASQGYKVMIHNLEMTDLELAERAYSDIASIDYYKFVQNQFTTTSQMAMQKAIFETRDWPLWIHQSTSEGIGSLVAKTEYEHMVKKIDVVFIDHLQRIENRSRQEKRHHLKDCCHQLKNLARRLGIVVVLLTQLKTGEGDDSEPNEADYSESKQIIEEADLAMMLHREPDEDGGKLIFVKVRKGRKCTAELKLEGEYQRFYEHLPEVVVTEEVDDGEGHHYGQTDFEHFN